MAGPDRRIPIRKLLLGAKVGELATVTGWVKTSRFSKNVSFVHLFDGSSTKTVQVILGTEQADALQARLGVGASVKARGRWVASPGSEQAIELAADEVIILGDCDPAAYPIQKKKTSLEFLRPLTHLRPRTNTFQSTFRVRNALAWQIHRYFQERGFMWVHTPLLTASDAEGAGELFAVQAGEKPESFFGERVFLTVSGQLEVEAFAEAFTDVYTFGPTFRAENSNTARHASEFWMIEPEIAFADLDDVIALAEDFLRTITRETLAQCPDDFDFFDQWIDKGRVSAIASMLDKPFARMTYTEAQEILARSGKTFEYPIGWGQALQAEHERFLAEEHVGGPVFVTHYPIEQKAFYMRVDEGERTVAATDLLVPRVGEIVGGSQREERLEVLQRRMASLGMHEGALQWYLDLRRFGSVPHGGFGLGFERALMWMTGMQNIRDVIAYPRTPGTVG